jgi:pimeloyl-ACP methyl ester carboxylesterase
MHLEARNWCCRIGVAVFAAIACHAAGAQADNLRAEIMRLGGQPCEDSTLTCVDIAVPVDYDHPESNRRLKIRFAVDFASGNSKGILLYAVGGPGAAGTALADSYLDLFGDDLTRDMDVVFFDQRGTGSENGVDCPKANLALDTADISADAPEAAVAAAEGFVAACLGEMKHRDLLPFLATDQAIRDVEAFRQAIGGPRIWLYGESYGTQLAQQYATRYPTAIQGLILDGVVDLTLDAQDFYAQEAVAAERILAGTFKACDSDGDCSADMGAPASSVYDRLMDRLKAGPLSVEYPLADGSPAKRQLTRAILDSDSLNALYSPTARADFLRALAAGKRGNFVPLLRLGYQNLAMDPETLAPSPDASWYAGAYYAITCPDFGESGHDPRQQVRKVLEQMPSVVSQAPRFARTSLAERLVCGFWPAKGTPIRPAPFRGGDYPTLVLNSTADPATPVEDGYAVFDHVKNGYMVTMEGGPHVIWGRGLACPDRIVAALMIDGRKPEKREQICRQKEIGDYQALSLRRGTAPPLDIAPLDIARAVETELAQMAEFANWDGQNALSVGCDFGGSVTAEAAQSGADYTFDNCSWWRGLAVSGEAISIDRGDGSAPDGMTLRVEISGNHQGKLVYRHDSTTQAMSLSGDFDGRPIAPLRPEP